MIQRNELQNGTLLEIMANEKKNGVKKNNIFKRNELYNYIINNQHILLYNNILKQIMLQKLSNIVLAAGAA